MAHLQRDLPHRCRDVTDVRKGADVVIRLTSRHSATLNIPLTQVPSPVVQWRQRCRFAIEVTEPQHADHAAGAGAAAAPPPEVRVYPDEEGFVRAPSTYCSGSGSGAGATAAAHVRLKTLEGNAKVRLVITQREPRAGGGGAAVDSGTHRNPEEDDDVVGGDADITSDGSGSKYIEPCYVDNGFPIASEAVSSAMIKLREQLARSWAAGRKSSLATKNLLEVTDGLRRPLRRGVQRNPSVTPRCGSPLLSADVRSSDDVIAF